MKRNILLNTNGAWKLFGFDYSVSSSENEFECDFYENRNTNILSFPDLNFVAPECILNNKCTSRSDYYSIGIHFRRVVKDHDGGNSEIAESMKTMQNDIANLTSTITDLKEIVQTQSTSLSTPTWPNKRQRGSSTDTPVKVAIPTASRGTKAMNSVPVIAAEPNDLWYLWLSSFPPSVTDEDIHSMVKECLSVEDDDPIVVKMLVKKGVDVSTLSSVTFKVGIGRDYRESSMDAANWPEGLSFREFVDIDRRPAPTVLPSGFSRRRLE
ncbi:hypothetical protein quinque_013887 [Culex quinquefasciatus]